jgi:hypothetical protein
MASNSLKQAWQVGLHLSFQVPLSTAFHRLKTTDTAKLGYARISVECNISPSRKHVKVSVELTSPNARTGTQGRLSDDRFLELH